jgi:hypothetical protein
MIIPLVFSIYFLTKTLFTHVQKKQRGYAGSGRYRQTYA